METRIEDVLEECLDLLKKGSSIDDCLAQYPADAQELEPLLQAASLSRQQLAIEMDGATRSRLRGRVMGAWDQQHRRQRAGAGIFAIFPRFAAVAASVVLVVALSGVGTVAASGGAVPGEALYPVKELREAAGLWFARSPEAKVEMYTRLVKERVEEVQELVAKEEASSSAISYALKRMEGNLTALDAVMNLEAQRQRSGATGPGPEFLEALQAAAEGQQSAQVILKGTLENAPDQAQPGMGAALQAIQQAQESVRAAVEAAGAANSGDTR